MVAGHAEILVPLNRRGGVDFTVFASSAQPGNLSLTWNDDVRVEAPLAPVPVAIRLHAEDVQRGLNTLAFDAPAGTRIEPILVHGLGPD
jgi:hypothetical protein